jgi:hypothetical protein
MKKLAVLYSVALHAASAWATVITDDFNRADVEITSRGPLIGPDWVRGNGGWGISNERLIQNMSSTQANSVLYNAALETISGGGANFTVSLDVMALGVDAWAGIAFNYQDVDHFYYFRFKGDAGHWALSRYASGKATPIASGTMAGTFALDTDYTLKVSSSEPFTFDYEIKETATGEVLVSGTAADSHASFTGGYAGVLQSNMGPNRNSFDNFRVEVISEPSTVGALE